jgi:flagellar basal-body rod protein FlgB
MATPPTVSPSIYDNPDGPTNNDGNTVDLEREMASLAENQVMYKAALQLINKKIAALKYAISEGR